MPGGGDQKTVSEQKLSAQQKKLLGLAMPSLEKYASTDLKIAPNIVNFGKTPGETQAQKTLLGTLPGLAGLSGTASGTAGGFMTTGGRGAMSGFGDLLRGGQDLVKQGSEIGALGRGTIGAGADLLKSGVGAATGGIGALLRDYGSTAGARNDILSGKFMDPNSPLVKAQAAAAIRPIQMTLEREVLPKLRMGSVGNNMFGGTRGGIAEGLATSDFQKQALDATTAVQTNAFNKGLDALVAELGGSRSGAVGATNIGSALAGTGGSVMGTGFGGMGAGASATGAGLGAMGEGARGYSNLALQAMMQAPQLGDFMLQPGKVQSAIAGQDRALTSANLREQNERFTMQQMLPFMKAQDIASLAFGMPGGKGVTSTSGGGPSGAEMGVAGAQSVAMLWPMLMAMSDYRLKENIRPFMTIGLHNWYLYNYIGDPTPHVGVIAQEVLEIQPEAVVMLESGYYAVDYGKLAMGKGVKNVRSR